CHPVYRMKTNVRVVLNPDGSATVCSGTQDIGTGTYTIATQIAADALGLPISKVHFSLGDTDFPEAPLSGGSMTAASAGSAVLEVCQSAIRKLAESAIADKNSALFGEKIDDIVAKDEGLYLKSKPDKGESLVSLLRRIPLGKLEITGSSTPDARTLEKYSKHTFGAHFAEVEVDPELGTIRVTRFLSAVAAGQVLNPKTAANQVKGGVVFGIGMALTEEIIRDQATGRTLNADLAEYHIPVHADIPDIEVLFVGEKDPHINPLGAKGIGEIAVIGVAAAVANAVFHASGKRVRELPVTLDKIL
ncbi:MAG: molybdopterin-dependent oxidoreductase, partial [Cyanobacteria bacterium]|nr:molybdopterin-dependent oxidoreductase [Cyanobacteriota bacterium]